MKILHVITSLYTGGAETLVVNLMPRFVALGHEVGVVVLKGERTTLMERLEKECPECKIYRLGNSFYNPWYIVKLIRIMRQYDIVHTHNTSPQFFAAMAAKVLCSVVLVTTEHNTSNRRRDWKWCRPVDRWMYNQYRKVICISRQAEENLKNYLKYCKSDILTIFNGVDVEAFHSANADMSLISEKKRFVVVMVAGFRYQKDHETLIRAMSHLESSDFELWLVGDGERRHILENLVCELNLDSCVKFLGLRQNVAEILHAADVVIMSSHFEGLSLSNIEGMAVGKPFIASDVDGLREMTEGYGILFPHGDAKKLAEIIQRLHDDNDYYQQVAEKCYERARQFDISQMVRQYNNVYLVLS